MQSCNHLPALVFPRLVFRTFFFFLQEQKAVYDNVCNHGRVPVVTE